MIPNKTDVAIDTVNWYSSRNAIVSLWRRRRPSLVSLLRLPSGSSLEDWLKKNPSSLQADILWSNVAKVLESRETTVKVSSCRGRSLLFCSFSELGVRSYCIQQIRSSYVVHEIHTSVRHKNDIFPDRNDFLSLKRGDLLAIHLAGFSHNYKGLTRIRTELKMRQADS